MKNIFTFSIAALLLTFLFASCVKETVVYNDNAHWLNQERGEVVYSSNTCGVYVVETNYGYTIVQNLDGLRTYEGDIVYGDFGGYGTRGFYNYTTDLVTSGNVVEYDLGYGAAQDGLDYYCPAVVANGFRLKQSPTANRKLSRTSGGVHQ